MLQIVAHSFVHRHSGTFTALGTLIAALLLVILIDRFLTRRGARLALAMTGGEGLPRDVTTRLRFARRTVEVLVIFVAIAIAMSQFKSLDRVGHALLASSAITAAVVGFAARQTLANAIAGILLAVVQPIRIGDLVTFEADTGTVEDITLTYTWLRTGADTRVLIPNERLAGGVLRNDSIGTATVAVNVTVWIAADADEAKALEAIAATGAQARIADATHDGIQLLVIGEAAPASERLAREAELRARALGALRTAGLR